MAAGDKEGIFEKVGEFFTQKPEDHDYEKAGGDAKVPDEKRTNDPLADANEYAVSVGKALPYPSHRRTASEAWSGVENVFNATEADAAGGGDAA